MNGHWKIFFCGRRGERDGPSNLPVDCLREFSRASVWADRPRRLGVFSRVSWHLGSDRSDCSVKFSDLAGDSEEKKKRTVRLQNSLPCIRNQPGNHWIFLNRLSGNGKKKRKRQRKSPHGKTRFRGRITTIHSSSPQEERGVSDPERTASGQRQVFRIDKTHPTIIGQLKDQAEISFYPSTAVSRYTPASNNGQAAGI